MKILTIVGARPQFIKAAAISREISKNFDIQEVIVHTGQHFDKNMSDVFFTEMQIPKPKYNLNINSLSHGAMTGRMLEQIEQVIITERPDFVLVFGDTNSTIAGALAAKKLHVKVIHIEAGLRSFNIKMPEEVNRILTDRISDILFCPTNKAIENLDNEGFANFNIKIVKSGDVMQDTAIFYTDLAKKPNFDVPSNFVLATIHRAENTDDIERLKNIFSALSTISEDIPVLLPLHPRTKKIIEKNNIDTKNIQIVDPVGYLEIVYLLKNSKLVLTDSGGMQKEAFFFSSPCITLRDETEWVELVQNGYNKIVGADTEKIILAYKLLIDSSLDFSVDLYGNGKASEVIIKNILEM
ncbi:MAG: UDP-N-acetylglucosamine 2-epimerase (non-hydrolyzing) [Bacteroidales bacterium]|nr:UDP-N-acetylglucosamine 2-epimerase (non-hydrolyzing) [Bacteroidales bacterium]